MLLHEIAVAGAGAAVYGHLTRAARKIEGERQDVRRVHVGAHALSKIEHRARQFGQGFLENLLDNGHEHRPDVALPLRLLVLAILMTSAREYLRLLAVQSLHARLDGDLVARERIFVRHLDRHVHRYTTQLVDDFLKLGKMHFGVMRDGNTRQLRHGLDGAGRSFDVVHLVDLNNAPTVQRIGSIARHGHQSNLLLACVDTG